MIFLISILMALLVLLIWWLLELMSGTDELERLGDAIDELRILLLLKIKPYVEPMVKFLDRMIKK